MALDVPTLCLGLLSRREATGYELKREFEEGPVSYFLDASYGSIYPALNTLLGKGLVECREEEGARGPGRKVYSITDEGRQALSRALTQKPAEDRLRLEFLFFLAFEDLLDPGQSTHIIDQKIADQKARIARVQDYLDRSHRSGTAFVLGYGLAMLTASVRYLEENRHLIEAVPAPTGTAVPTGKSNPARTPLAKG